MSSPESPLGRRIDFEVIRAREWRDDRLQPLTDGGVVPAPTDTPADVAVARARTLLAGGTTPGRVAGQFLAALLLVALIAAAGAGAQLASRVLGDPSLGPVNIVWYLLHALGLQTVLLVVTLLASLPSIRRLLGRRLSSASLGGLLVRSAVRLAQRTAASDDTTVTDRLSGLDALRPLALSASNAAWVTFNVAFLLSSALILSAQHHTFAWQSTLIRDDEIVYRSLRLMTAPASIWPGPATRTQVEVSRWDPGTGAFLAGLSDGDAELRQAWSLQLLAAVAGWGLIPRLGLLLSTWLGWRRARRSLEPTDEDPYVVAVLRHVLPSVETDASAVTETDQEHPVARAENAADATRWLVAPHLSAGRGHDPVTALWGGPHDRFTALPRLDSRASEHDALARVRALAQAGVGLMLLCDYAATPDGALVQLISDLRAALAGSGPIVVLLVGGDSFRATRLGASAGGVARRRRVWVDSLARCGIAPEQVVDHDLERATSGSRARLATTLGVEPMTAAGPAAHAGLERALAALAEQAPGWVDRLAATPPPDRDDLALRLAAEGQRLVDGFFTNAAPAHAPAAMVAAARAAIASTLRVDGLEAKVLDQTARSFGQMLSILRRARALDPRFVVAGAVAGLVAGPLGGALIAGGSGLIAGASIAGTLATLGAALGGAVSIGGDGGPTPADTGDIGLPVRAALTRAVVLAHQDRNEDEIAALLERLAASPEAAAPVTSAEHVAALIESARRSFTT